MTPVDDYPGEMSSPRQVDDATVERLVAGRADSPDLEPVATVVRALREVSAQPVEPSAVLRQQMAAGVFTGAAAYPYRPATRGLVRRLVAAAAIRVGRLRLATRLAAAALAVAVLGTATAGFAGSLPAPVQDRFETVVESVTPYQFGEKTGRGGGGPAGDADTTGPGAGDRDPASPDPAGPGITGPGQPGGVSQDANDGGVEGPEVSQRDGGRPTDLPPPAQEAPGQGRRPTAPPGLGS